MAKENKARNQAYSSPGMALPNHPEAAAHVVQLILEARQKLIGCDYSKTKYIEGKLPPDPTRAPIYIISGNRSRWLLENLKTRTFWGPLRETREIILVCGAGEEKAYAEVQNVFGVSLLLCSGGFGIGWNRHCAIRHARDRNTVKIWMLDDDVVRIKIGSEVKVEDLDDTLLKQPFVSLYPGIAQQALGFNLQLLHEAGLGNVNFCPVLAYSKEDLSLAAVLQQADIWSFLDVEVNVEKTPKEKIQVDEQGTRKDRSQPMADIAALPVWCDENNKPYALDKELSSYEVMKLQEQAVYDFLSNPETPEAFKLLEPYFNDACSKGSLPTPH